MALDRAKILARFLDEAREHLARINDGLLTLERTPADEETTNAVFRAVHSIKGSARMIKQTALATLAHRMEDLLDALRNKKIEWTSPRADLLFRATDALKDLLDLVSAGHTVETLPEALLEELSRAVQAEDDPATVPQPIPEAVPIHVEMTGDQARAYSNAVQDSPVPARSTETPSSESIRIKATKLDNLIKLMGEIISAQSRYRQSYELLSDMGRLFQRLSEALGRLAAKQENPTDLDYIQHEFQDFESAMNIALRTFRDDALTQELFAEELQDVSLKMRMMPLATIFDSFGRSVRDLSRSLGKEVELAVKGGETEIDKNIIDKIGDPLLHLIRNAIDHGFESVAERRRAGKPPRGRLTLSANSEGNHVLITIQDDGRGISLGKIKEKALQKKIVDPAALDLMSELELIDMIFKPGFSTSPIITDFSGRGVGMDVVRKNIVDELKGTIRVETQEGSGTTFFLRLPLTLAIFRLLLVETGGVACALPAHWVREIVLVKENELTKVVGKLAIRLRDQLVPVEVLARVLGLPDSRENTDALIVVFDTGNEIVGYIVDQLITEENMVVKPLPTHLRGLRLASGVTIAGDGRIANVLNIPELTRMAREMTAVARVAPAPKDRKKISILVVDDSLNTREIERNILEANGYQVALAGDGMEALDKLNEMEFDLVITDVEMPRLDGFSLTQRLRLDERYRFTPIIIVTSREKEEDKRRGIAVGADAYIVKGAFDQTNLLDTVRDLAG